MPFTTITLHIVPHIVRGLHVLFVCIGSSFILHLPFTTIVLHIVPHIVRGLLVLFVSIGSSFSPTLAIHNNCPTYCTSYCERTACSVCKYWFFF